MNLLFQPLGFLREVCQNHAFPLTSSGVVYLKNSVLFLKHCLFLCLQVFLCGFFSFLIVRFNCNIILKINKKRKKRQFLKLFLWLKSGFKIWKTIFKRSIGMISFSVYKMFEITDWPCHLYFNSRHWVLILVFKAL